MSAEKRKPANYRLKPEAAKIVEGLAAHFPGMSENAIVERCVIEMNALAATTPGDRQVPLLVKQVDAAAISERFLDSGESNSQSEHAEEVLMRAKRSAGCEQKK